MFQEIITRCWPHFFKQLQNNNMITHKLIFCIFCKFPVQELKICSFITYLSLVLYQSKLILADEEGRNVVDQCENVSYVWFTHHLCKNLIFRFTAKLDVNVWLIQIQMNLNVNVSRNVDTKLNQEEWYVPTTMKPSIPIVNCIN